jgi:DNA-binding HxlR family transcriptional regulator
MTPAEERVMEVIRQLPFHKRTSTGFKRKDLEVPGVSDRRLNEILKSLAETGYLESDGRAGPQGYEYTLTRDEEKTTLGISLRPAPESPESAANEHNLD